MPTGAATVPHSGAPPILVTSTRCGVTETAFRGCAVLVDASGAPVWSCGDVTAPTFPRSAIKLIQALPVLMSGAVAAFGFTDEEIAIMCASHSGEPAHVATVRSILSKAGLSEEHLGCGALTPLGAAAAEALFRSGDSVGAIHNNCSGKHAGFLAACKLLGHDLRTYLSLDHPLQVSIRAELCHFAELRDDELVRGIDGCSAPNYAMPVIAMARLFKNIAHPQADAARESARAAMVRALTAHPYFIAGEGRYCTALCTACPQLLGKVGAEGFYGVSLLQRGWGLAAKIESGGSLGPQYNVVQAVLEAAGVVTEEAAVALAHFAKTPVLTVKGECVGSREAVAEIRESVREKVAALKERVR